MSTEKTFSSSRREILTMALTLLFLLALMVYLCPCFAVEVSKACYGVAGSCIIHNLRCSSGRIEIQEAFHTNSTDCPKPGNKSCDQFNVSSIELNDTRHNFSATQLESLIGNCSTQSECSIRALWDTTGHLLFSAITYQCINRQSSTPQAIVKNQENVGAIAGGVIGVLVVCVIVAAVVIWFKFVRNKKEDKKRERGSTNHVCGASLSTTATEHKGSRKTTSNYDYATIHNGDNPVGHVQNEYVLGKPNTENGTTVSLEDDYNHINHKSPQGTSSPGYDTTASAAAAVKTLKNASNSVDDDDYNHLGEGKPSVVSSDFDTTVSVSKAVAQVGKMKDNEDDYDHFKRSEDSVIDSPYDTANHHSSILADLAPSPYDLAK